MWNRNEVAAEKRRTLGWPGSVAALLCVLATACSSAHDGLSGTDPDATASGGNTLVDDPSNLVVDHAGGVSFSGEEGGVFLPAAQVFTLRNAGTTLLNWVAAADQDWLVLSTSGGVLAPNASMELSVTLDADRVFDLTPMNYSANVNFRFAPTTPIVASRRVDLSVIQGPPGELTVTPAEDYQILGNVGGPFTPLAKTYTLSNTGAGLLRYATLDDAPWLQVQGNLRSSLRPGQSKVLTVALVASAAGTLPGGTHHATVRFVDLRDSSTADSFGVDLVIQASGGWTNLVASPDTRKVYVSSSSGNDLFNGLSPLTPKATIAAGVALLRHTYPDWLHLKTGDTWQESLGQWKKSGRSATERMVVTSYGTSTQRPRLRTGTSDGVSAGTWGGSPPSIDHVAIVGLHFQPHQYTGSQGTPMGVAWRIKGQNLLLEDCRFEGYFQNIVVEPLNGRAKDFAVRRCVVVDAYTTSASHAQGMYLYGIDGVLIEENVFDHNGWSETVNGAVATIFRHNIYVQSGTYGVRAIGNIIANGGSHGLQLRSGGLAEDNLFLRNSVSLLLGGGNTPDPAGVTAEARNNVIMDGKNIDAQNGRGWGIDLTNVASATVSGNIIANQTIGTQPIAINLYGGSSDGIGVHNTTIENNTIWNWGGPVIVQGGPPTLTNITIRDNTLQEYYEALPLIHQFSAASTDEIHSSGNVFYGRMLAPSSWTRIGGANYSVPNWKLQVGDTTSTSDDVIYHDEQRTVASYNATIGGVASLPAFLTEARKQSKANWRPEYTARAANAYIRQGFLIPVN